MAQRNIPQQQCARSKQQWRFDFILICSTCVCCALKELMLKAGLYEALNDSLEVIAAEFKWKACSSA